MNFKERLEHLRERFLRCDSLKLYNAACVEGGYLLKGMIEGGLIPFSSENLEFWRSYFNEVDPIHQELQFRGAFQLAAQVLCEIPNTLNISWEKRNPSVSVGSMEKEPRVLSEKMASFCLELLAMLEVQSNSEPNDIATHKDKHSTLDSIAATFNHRTLKAVDQCEVELKALLESKVVDSTWTLEDLAVKMRRTKRTVLGTPTWRSWHAKE